MSSLDENINLLLGSPIPIENKFIVKQFTLREIKDSIGFYNYYRFLNTVCIDTVTIQILLKTIEKVNVYDFILMSCYHDQTSEFTELICQGLSMMLGEPVYYNKEHSKLHTENNIIGMLDFEDIVEALKINHLSKEEKTKIENERQLEYQIAKEKAKAKYCTEDKGDLSDIISAICAKHSGINFCNILDLTVYQVMNLFYRLNAIEKYNISIDSLIHGASSNEVNLVHWSEKLD